MRMNGTLNSYLREVNEQAEEMTFQLVKQFAKQEGVTEELKQCDQMAWVGAMNNIHNRAREIVMNEVILICDALDCQPGDLLEYAKDEELPAPDSGGRE